MKDIVYDAKEYATVDQDLRIYASVTLYRYVSGDDEAYRTVSRVSVERFDGYFDEYRIDQNYHYEDVWEDDWNRHQQIRKAVHKWDAILEVYSEVARDMAVDL